MSDQSFQIEVWLLENARRDGDCWIWRHGLTTDGYGKACLNRKTFRANRVAWMLAFGPIPLRVIGRDGSESTAFVLHNCPGGDNRACVNPNHLWLGTHKDNMADMEMKGRKSFASRALSAEDVLNIRKRARNGESARSIASSYPVVKGVINNILAGISYRAITEERKDSRGAA